MNDSLPSLGSLRVEAGPAGIRRVRFGPGDVGCEVSAHAEGSRGETDPEVLELARAGARQLEEYLRGRRTRFDLPLDLTGATPFRRRVLAALLDIPYGECRSYGEVALRVGCASPRAVGGAVGWNPLPIIVPCHRVVGSDGGLGGFSGGLWRKRALLALEGRVPAELAVS